MSIEALKEALQEAAVSEVESKPCAYSKCTNWVYREPDMTEQRWENKKFCSDRCRKNNGNQIAREKAKVIGKPKKAPAKLPKKSGYYDAGGLSTLDIMQAKLTPEQYKGFLLGCIIKYSCRLNHKGQDVSDSDKTAVYAGLLRDLMAEVEK